ncbi:hypothetical protein BDF22DRAFT_629679 [Syncephalis plumigaleata]|nr:hypothetical protein BDF22DRAFT_629679 [Syncephalis plumigaleata]
MRMSSITTTTTITTTTSHESTTYDSTRSTGSVVNPNYEPQPYQLDGYRSFAEFYPFYLGEHRSVINRRLHLLGTGTALTALATMIASGRSSSYIPLAFVPGYFFAWIGHFIFEKNKPATFKHPFYSLLGDLRLFFEVVIGRRRF